MKKIWLLGWISYTSSALYYNQLNKALKNPEFVLYNLDFDKISSFQKNRDFTAMEKEVLTKIDELGSLECDIIAICSNTTWILSDEAIKTISQSYGYIYVDIYTWLNKALDRVPQEEKILLLWTSATMESEVYKKKLSREVVTDGSFNQLMDEIIYENLCVWLDPDFKKYEQLVTGIIDSGCKFVILGCTELSLLKKYRMVSLMPDVVLIDPTLLHIDEIVTKALWK